MDVRNDFEVQMDSVINPKTKNFTEFKAYVKNNLNDSKIKIAMFLLVE